MSEIRWKQGDIIKIVSGWWMPKGSGKDFNIFYIVEEDDGEEFIYLRGKNGRHNKNAFTLVPEERREEALAHMVEMAMKE